MPRRVWGTGAALLRQHWGSECRTPYGVEGIRYGNLFTIAPAVEYNFNQHVFAHDVGHFPSKLQ
jgi:hypothetical protein